ncbi:DDE transposase [Paenibacillus sp. GCM10023252]|uniref:DDE transposase n=1 Tax=Paenibacillus sp. GCM10023252 TaxID=3252649 RepID=UPI003607325E
MHNSRTPLMKWILTMYLVSQQDSINAVRLADVIQVTYKTAWLMLHKLRDAMSQVEEEELLSGEVQIHTHVYGLQRCKPTFNRLAHEHPILIGSSHHVGEENSLTHLKLHQLTTPDLDGNLLTKYGAAQFSERHVEQSATITSIVQHYGRTRRIPILHHYVTDTISWMNWKFNGIGGKHLQAYLHEYCYRFNRVVRHQSAFNTLVLTSMLRRYPTYKDLVARDYRRRYEFNSHGLQAA